jgi:uncharacterized glyoxalase superfamily protein PhnB
VAVLGFTEARRYEREGQCFAVALQAGAVRILLTQDDGSKGWDREKGAGMSLQITTHQSADALAERVRQRGGTIDTEPVTMPHGARVFRLRDLDGYRLTVSSTPPSPNHGRV